MDTHHLPIHEEMQVWSEQDDKEPDYAKWHRYTAKTTHAEECKIRPPLGNFWPHWVEGVPKRLRQQVGSPAFSLGTVEHKYRVYYESLDFDWDQVYPLSELKNNKYLLPNHSGGVYRILTPNASIVRCCGTDPTGTLYLGCAGTRRNWSNLRTRIKNILDRDHHAIANVSCNELVQKTFPWNSLAVQWAYMGERTNYKGQSEPAAILGEGWLLWCYRDSFGENPPWNQKG